MDDEIFTKFRFSNFGDFFGIFLRFLEIFMDLSDDVVTPLYDKYFDYSINYQL